MIVKRTSLISGITREKDLDVTKDQIQRHRDGEKLQNVFPHLSQSDREFIKTGITDEEWNEMNFNASLIDFLNYGDKNHPAQIHLKKCKSREEVMKVYLKNNLVFDYLAGPLSELFEKLIS
jgi:hypothetical protein